MVQISPGRVQMLGVRTAHAKMRALSRTVRAAGTAGLNERRLAVVTTRVAGWAEKLHVAANGDAVTKGQPLLELYSPDLVTAEQEYLVAAGLNKARQTETLSVTTSVAGRSVCWSAYKRSGHLKMKSARLRRTGKIERSITMVSPADGVVIEKNVVEGMRVESDMPLYRIADLSTIWLIAEIQEQDLDLVRPDERLKRPSSPSRTVHSREWSNSSIQRLRQTRTGRVRIVVPNLDYALRADMYATV